MVADTSRTDTHISVRTTRKPCGILASCTGIPGAAVRVALIFSGESRVVASQHPTKADYSATADTVLTRAIFGWGKRR